jgi:metal-responsive CopG/Arc/MetJ family transcriptional regulator
MATPKRTAGRPPSKAKKQAINITLPRGVYATLERFRTSGEFKIERSDVIEKALVAYFTAKGVKIDSDD